jgi:hypothetical protein
LSLCECKVQVGVFLHARGAQLIDTTLSRRD